MNNIRYKMIYIIYITLIKNVESLPVSGPTDSTHITEQYTPEMGCFSLSVISSVPDVLNATYKQISISTATFSITTATLQTLLPVLTLPDSQTLSQQKFRRSKT
jgi:hypothetical protein